jgi:hypothetical protein
MPIFHKIIFSIKGKAFLMLSKGKFICMLKRKFCVASFRFFTIIILFVPFRIKKLNILPLVIYMVHDYSFFGSTADFVIKKGTFGIFTGFGHFQMSETSGRNKYTSF